MVLTVENFDGKVVSRMVVDSVSNHLGFPKTLRSNGVEVGL